MKENLTANCTFQNLPRIREFLRKQVGKYIHNPLQQNQLTLAAEEVCANRIQHANACDPKRKIEVCIYEASHALYIEIIDEGEPFEFMKINSVSEKVAQNIKEEKKRGLGIPIISETVDDIQFLREGKKFICRLVKKLK